MIIPSDSAICQREEALVGLERVLDPDYIRQGLANHGIGVDDFTSIKSFYIRYKPQTSALVAYRLKIANIEHLVYVRLHLASAPEKVEKPLRRALKRASTLGPAAIRLDGLCGLIMIFPNDHELVDLHNLQTNVRQKQPFNTILANASTAQCNTLECLAYKPERRYVGKLTLSSHESYVLKLYDRRTHERCLQNTSRASFGHFSFSQKVLGVCDSKRLIVYPWIRGEPLEARMVEEMSVLQTVGSRLARFHATHRTDSLQLDPAEALQMRIHETDHSIGEIAPELSDRSRFLAIQLIDQWSSYLRQNEPMLSLIHGDFSPDQVLIGDDGPWFIDFDRSQINLPVHDLGSFIARIEYQVLIGQLSSSARLQVREHLVSAYQSASQTELGYALELSIAAHLFFLVTEPFRRRHQQWLAEMNSVLDHIINLLPHTAHGH